MLRLPPCLRRAAKSAGIKFVEGLFQDTVFDYYYQHTDSDGTPKLSIAVLRLDGNFYSSHEKHSLYASFVGFRACRWHLHL